MKLFKRLILQFSAAAREARHILRLLGSGRTQAAYELALKAGPFSQAIWSEIARATACHGQEAGPLLFHALRSGGHCYPLLNSCGAWLFRQEQPLLAYAYFSAAHRLAPLEPAPLLALGEVHLALGNFHAAAEKFMAAYRRGECDPQTIAKLQLAREHAGLPPLSDATTGMGALPHLEKARALQCDDPEAASWLARVLVMLERHEEACTLALSALENAAQDAGLLAVAAESAALTQRHDEAIALYERLLAVEAKMDANAWSNYGTCLARLERFEQAVAPLETAVAMAPESIAARLNLSYALYFSGQHARAEAYLNTLLEKERNDFEARMFFAHLHLAAGDFVSGWRGYEYRHVQLHVLPRLVPLPPWRGESLAGKKIVVTAEQGVGDQIMFASCLDKLIQQAAQVVFECEPRLQSLFARSFPAASVVASTTDSAPQWLEIHRDADFHIPVGSLPGFFRCAAQAFDETRFPYLVPDKKTVDQFAAQLAGLGPGLKVGIAWRGGVALSRMRSRSIELNLLAPILTMPDCRFISLQYGDHADEIEKLSRDIGIPILNWPESLANLDHFAALTAALDVIVTVCSAPVHFAGAQNKPAIVLTPHTPEWRYAGIDRHMRWYPSVTLLPQTTPGDWEPVIRQTRVLLEQRLAKKGSH